jgi:outer membrane immunogenic protein
MLKAAKSLGFLLWASSSLCWASGFYAGIGIGPEYGDIRINSTVIDNIGGNFFVKNQDYEATRGVFGTLFAGYGLFFNNFWSDCENLYLAAEINANISSSNSKDYNKELIHQSFSHTNYKMKESYGVSLLPGFLITDSTLFYTRLGYSSGKFKLDTNDVSLSDIDTHLNGFRYGVGLQQVVIENLSLRLEYSDVAYTSVSTFTTDLLSGVTKETNFSPQTSSFEFSAVYNF